MSNLNIYHYTTNLSLQGVLKDGVIKKSFENVPKKRMRAVWFSTNPFWEETANKSVLDMTTGKIRSGDKFDTYNVGNGLARIQVRPEAAPVTWADYVRIGRVPAKLQRGLITTAQHRLCTRTIRRVGLDSGLVPTHCGS